MGQEKQQRLGPEMMQGTLDMLILHALTAGPRHGYGIARHVEQASGDLLRIGENSLYPALQRLLLKGWVTAEWGSSENNRRARFYTLTAAGRRHLASEQKDFDHLVTAIRRVLQTA